MAPRFLSVVSFRFLAAGVLSLFPFFIGVGCRPAQHAAAQPPPPAVTAQQPLSKEIIDWDEYPGWLDAVDSVEVRARVTGYLQSVHFKDGALVNKGDLLFVIDPRPYEAERARAQAARSQAQTRLELSKNDLARAERLLKGKAISEEEADSRSKAVREAEDGLRSAAAALQMAELNLEYTQITAPISGRIGRKLITEGNLVNGGQGQSTLLTTIVSMDPIYCYFDPHERSVLHYQKLAREGKGPNFRDGKVVCELELANETGYPHKGVLDFVDNRMNASTGTLRVRALVPNPGPDFVLQPGFFARIRVPASEKYPALLIPDRAIGTDQEQKFVYVVNGEDAIEYKRVDLGPLVEGSRVVRHGLSSNDWVVVNGLMSVRPGVKVKPERTSGATNQANSLAAARK